MIGALEGFWVVVGVALLGYLAARSGLLDETAQDVLATVAFHIASPCLLLGVLGHADIREVLSAPLLVAAGSLVLTVACYLVVARARWPLGLGETVIAAMGASYVNAANLGIPVATFVLHDAALVAPTLLLQLCVVTPVAMTLLDVAAAGHRPRPLTVVAGVLRNPMTMASLTGVVLALLGWYPPAAVMRPVEVVGQLAVPAMLLAFGVSLHAGPRPGAAGGFGHLAWITTCKLVAQPVAALGIGFALAMPVRALWSAVVVAALPCAQNVFTHAVRYRRAPVLARDAVLVTTLAGLPVLLAISLAGALLLG